MTTSDPFNVPEFLEAAINHEADQKITLFAGAGISIDSGLPNFVTFGRNMIQKICGETVDSVITREQLDKLLYLLRPEVLLQTLSTTFGEGMCEFSEWLTGETPNPNHRFLARALKNGHLVITTNLDILIEKAFEELTGEPPRIVVTQEEFKILSEELETSGFPSCPTVLKPHGTIDTRYKDPQRRFASVRVCLDQVGLGLTRECRASVEHYIKTTPMVFMGYSGCDHFSLTPVLTVTPTEHKSIWLFHDTVHEVIESHEPIREVYEDIVKQVYCGKVYADINRGMELHAVCDILLSKKNIVQWKGNVSQLFREVTGDNTFERVPSITFNPPEWVQNVTEVQKQLMVARLYKKAGQKSDCLESAEKGLKCLPETEDSKIFEADLMMLIAEIEMEKSTPTSCEKAIELYEKCMSAYCDSANVSGQKECKIEIVNVLRRNRKFKGAMEKLDELEKIIQDSESYESLNKHLIRILLMRGLIIGLSGDKSIEDKESAVAILREAVESSMKNGYVLLESSCLNSLALVLFQISGDNLEKLLEAEKYLYDALNLNVYCGQTRSCFQQYRNLGLVHAKMAEINPEPEEKKSLYQKALSDYENTEKYLQRSTAGFVEGEMLEAKFRQSEALVRLEKFPEALDTLVYIISRRQANNDWHNEARAIDLILQTDKVEHYCQYMGRLLDIYNAVVKDESKLKIFKAQAFRFTNAKGFFDNAIAKADLIECYGVKADLMACFKLVENAYKGVPSVLENANRESATNTQTNAPKRTCLLL